MKPLDLVSIRQKAPYEVRLRNNERYFIRTKYGVEYEISFMDDFSIWAQGAYQFIIANENNKKSPNDPLFRETIFCLIEAFFEANPDILLYVCETGDGKEALRNKLFLRWIKQYAQADFFVIEHFEIEAEGIMNFAAIIVQRSNPDLQTIMTEFHEAVNELAKPGEHIEFNSL